MGYMLLKCLYMEMEGNTLGMRRGARAGYALKSIVDFAEASKRSMRDAAPAFFGRMRRPGGGKEYEKMYEDYVDKLKKRAVDKKKEEEAAAAEEATRRLQLKGDDKALEELPREERLGPGVWTRLRCLSRCRRRCRTRSRAAAWRPFASTSTGFPWRMRSTT